MLKKIIGTVLNLEVSEAMMQDGQKIRKQGLLTALASSAMGQPSPGSIILAGHKGFKGKLIKFKINCTQFTAIFTDIHFENNDIIVVIYDDEIEEGDNCVAVLNPRNGILSMEFKLGNGRKASIKTTMKLLLIIYFLCIVFSYFILFISNDPVDPLPLYIYVIFPLFTMTFITIIILIATLLDKKYDLLSEEIFKLLGFKNVENINLMDKQIKNEINILQSFDYEYREAVDYDPYPPECIPELLKEIEDATKKD